MFKNKQIEELQKTNQKTNGVFLSELQVIALIFLQDKEAFHYCLIMI